MDGKKTRLDDITGTEIEVIGFKFKRSRFEKSNSEEVLMIQFIHGGERMVAFTGSTVLADQAKRYQSEIPFRATIRKIDKYYTFS